MAGRPRLHVLLAVAQHSERSHELGVLLEVRPRSADGEVLRVVDAHAEPENELVAELELAAVATRDGLEVTEPAIDELLGGGGDDALDAVLRHEVEPAGAAAHDGLPDLHGKVQGPRHERDL